MSMSEKKVEFWCALILKKRSRLLRVWYHVCVIILRDFASSSWVELSIKQKKLHAAAPHN